MKRVFLILFILILALAGAAWWWLRESLPHLDGEVALSGLTSPVEVILDGHGVPHVYAAGAEDAWFVAGALHARDRLWQMELYRRAASGRLSEVLGAATLPIDRRFLTLDLRAAAEAEWRVAPPAGRAALTRYAAGVNAQVALSVGRKLPIEFQLLGFRPGEWSPIDTLAIGRLLAWRLAENHQAELVRHALAARFGSEVALQLGGQYPSDGPAVLRSSGVERPGATETGAAVRACDRAEVFGCSDVLAQTAPHRSTTFSDWPRGLEWLHPSARRGGSNNWVLSGKRTASGRPLLANDPHLQLEFPGVWYEMHLVAADLQVIGVTVPGSPFVVLGHNARIAWGMTNSGADVQDLYIDRVDLARRQYWYQGQWLPVQVKRIDIPVRDAAPEPLEVWRTHHGSVFAEVGLEWEDAPAWLDPDVERNGERRVYTLRWDSAAGEMAGAFEALNRAASWSDFITAIERFAAPSQNFVYADVEGNIGYAMSGALPQRSALSGAMPHDGSTGEGEWSGLLAASQLPRAFNPASGYLTSSNNLIERGMAAAITRDWAAPYRAARLQQLIDAASGVDSNLAMRWQNDVAGGAANDVLRHSEAALALATSQGRQAAADALRRLRAWDRQMDDQPTATLYHLFEAALWNRTFFDEMGDPLFNRFYEWAGAERPAGLYVLLEQPNSRWFDDIATLDRRESRDDILVLAAEDAAIRFAEEYGGDRRWSDAHAARFEHPVGSRNVALAWLFNRGPVPLNGDSYTVNRSSYHRLRPFAAWEIPSWRQIFDVGQWDEAHVVLPGGQSGHPLSPYYFDQNELWRQGQYRRQPFSRSAVDAVRAHRLLFVP